MSTYIIVRGKEYSSLSHFGIKGMKWGVRKDNPHPMTRRQTKKAIRTAKRQYRKETGK